MNGTTTQSSTFCLRIFGSTIAHRKVIMQANKNGYFYVIDRTNGGIHLRITEDVASELELRESIQRRDAPIFIPTRSIPRRRA